MNKTIGRVSARTRTFIIAMAAAFVVGATALAGCAASDSAEGTVSAARTAGVMTIPSDHYDDAGSLKLAENFTQCSECHESITDFAMDGEHDLLSMHAVEFKDSGDEIDCILCHDATVSRTDMVFEEIDSDGMCKGCHDMEEVKTKTEDWNGQDMNPHDTQHGLFSCSSCHTMHTETQSLYCNKCHHFETPEGWVSPDYVTETDAFGSF